MSTRSMIAVERNDGTYRAVYCHTDGEPERVGRVLETYYSSDAQAKALIRLGDLSWLGETPVSVPAFWDIRFYENMVRGSMLDRWMDRYCRAFRDRGHAGDLDPVYPDSMTPERVLSSFDRGKGNASYLYVWDGERWMVADHHADKPVLTPVADVLELGKAA